MKSSDTTFTMNEINLVTLQRDCGEKKTGFFFIYFFLFLIITNNKALVRKLPYSTFETTAVIYFLLAS